MRGSDERSGQLFSYVDLEARVRGDHPLRAIRSIVNDALSDLASHCPGCGAASARIHSRYQRRLTDLPIANRPVRIVVLARRFHCDAVLCGRRIFAERFDEKVLAPWARRTTRLDQIVHCLGLALGGRPAASFARRLLLPVSNDTLLRVVRRVSVR
jgi:hypothetical protein